MNLQEIIDEINKDLEDTLDTDELTGWINRCIDDITPYAKVEKLTTIPLVADQKNYDLPEDYLKLVQVVNTDLLYEVPLRDFQSAGYKLFGNQITIQPAPTEDGSMDLYYLAKLPRLENMEDEPQIPSQFHDLFILYTVAKRQYQDEEEGLQMNAWNEYLARKRDFIQFYAKAKYEPIRDVYGTWQTNY